MSDKSYFEEPNRTIQLRVWALGQMIWGAFLAGAFVLAVGGALWAVYALGQFLPEESKQAPPPMGALDLTLGDTIA